VNESGYVNVHELQFKGNHDHDGDCLIFKSSSVMKIWMAKFGARCLYAF
jgi:hypothetical protein